MSDRTSARRSARPAPITLTRPDHERLLEVVDRYAGGRSAHLAAGLDDELARARVVEQTAIPPDIITMNSRCVFRFAGSDDTREVTLVYPEDADVDRGRISVLAPVGTALLGLAVGQTIRWPTPEGERSIEVVALPYQPEAAGDLQL